MNKIKTILLTILGTMSTGFGLGSFLTPNKIVGGGIGGVGTILYHTLGIEPGMTSFVGNIFLLIIGIRILGKKFVLKTAFGVLLLSLFVQLFSMLPIYTENLMLSAVFGGALFGLGIGLAFAAGSSTGGTDIVGRMIQIQFSSIPIGKLLLAVDGMIILVSLLVFKDVELILYGIVTLFFSSYCIDFVISRLNVSRLAFVITDKGEEIAKNLVSTSTRGVTLIDVRGAYTDTQKQMLFCALKESEAEKFQNKILDVDENAFIVFSESQRIKGKGFYLYK